MNLEEYLEKSYILGGRCPNCNGFLFTEVTGKEPLRVIKRCLKCGDMEDVTDQVRKIIGGVDPCILEKMVVSIPKSYPLHKYVKISEFDHRKSEFNRRKKEEDFLFLYEKRLLGE